MKGHYEVKLGPKKVGKVQVVREGLYYRFICHCSLTGDVVSKLVVRCGDKCENIGVLIPYEDNFSLDKKHPIKKFGNGIPEFYLAPRHDSIRGKFIPIYPEEPFAYIARLKEAFLVYHNGQAGAMLKEPAEFDYDML